MMAPDSGLSTLVPFLGFEGQELIIDISGCYAAVASGWWRVKKPSSVECPASRFAAELLAETGSGWLVISNKNTMAA